MSKRKVMNCLARTSSEFFKFITQSSNQGVWNFWKLEDTNFHVLKSGGKMYLYDSDLKSFIGVATFNGTSNIMDVASAWKYYGIKNGQPSLQQFKDLLSKQTNIKKKFSDQSRICCIEIQDVKQFVVPMEYNYKAQQIFKKLWTNIYDNADLYKRDAEDELIKNLENRETIKKSKTSE